MTRKRSVGIAVASLVVTLALGGCGSRHVAESTALEDIPSVTPPTSPSVTVPSPTGPTSAQTTTSPTAGPTDRDFAAIRRLMAARAQAVVDADEDAFMTTVDLKRPMFVAAQKVVYENLQDLPVTSMSYEVGTSGLTNATGITGGPLLTPPVVEHVFFSGTDRAPVATQVNDTFVKRAGHWRLAADTTDPEAAGDTARPWAGPRIDVVVRGHLIVVADASTTGQAASVADAVEEDLDFDAAILDVPVDDHLMVDATSFGSVSKFDNEESAGAVTFTVRAGEDFEATRFAGLRVKLNPEHITELLSNDLILRHELTHFLMFRYSGLTPLWLTEGLAEYVAFQPGGLATEYLSSDTYDRLVERRQELTVSGLFGQDPATDYPLALACVTYLVEHGGVSKVVDLMAAYAEHTDGVYGDEYTGQLLRRIYGLSPAEVAHGAFDLLDALR